MGLKRSSEYPSKNKPVKIAWRCFAAFSALSLRTPWWLSMNVKRCTEGLARDLPVRVVRGKVELVEVTGDRRWGSLRFCITHKYWEIAGQ